MCRGSRGGLSEVNTTEGNQRPNNKAINSGQRHQCNNLDPTLMCIAVFIMDYKALRTQAAYIPSS